MMMTLTTPRAPAPSLRGLADGLSHLLGRFPLAILQLIFRLSIASVFFKSGHSKILSWDTTILLFANEYHVPLLGPELAATLAASFSRSPPILAKARLPILTEERAAGRIQRQHRQACSLCTAGGAPGRGCPRAWAFVR